MDKKKPKASKFSQEVLHEEPYGMTGVNLWDVWSGMNLCSTKQNGRDVESEEEGNTLMIATET